MGFCFAGFLCLGIRTVDVDFGTAIRIAGAGAALRDGMIAGCRVGVPRRFIHPTPSPMGRNSVNALRRFAGVPVGVDGTPGNDGSMGMMGIIGGGTIWYGGATVVIVSGIVPGVVVTCEIVEV